MESLEHLKDRFGDMLFDCHAGAEGSRVRRGCENYRRQIAARHTLAQGVANLTHHRDVKDVERRPRESDARDPIVDSELDGLEFFRHLSQVILQMMD
jgi:hypothetical protein